DASLNFIPKMDAARLVEGYKNILRHIYNPAEYYQRALDCLNVVRQDSDEPVRGSLLHNAISLLRVVFTLGIRDHARREFWRFLRQVRRAHPNQFVHAVTLAAMGYHFRKLTDSYCN
ncbi:MAG TPA: DUF4070 domain-containing protein, partial [Blastocatellia bacterium]|nr:DUF4070 domain-containing protein [Blastocatellia bacterium]